MKILAKLRYDQILIVLMLIFVLATLPVFFQSKEIKINYLYELINISNIAVKNNNYNLDILDQISAEHILVLDIDSASILLEKNATHSAYIASTTKLMTALVAVENYDLDQVFVVKDEHKVDGHKTDLFVGEEISVRDLLASLLIMSGNDAALVLANNYPGGYESFVNKMNQKAQDLDLINTNFTNPIGLDEADNLSTARDLGVLAREFMKNDFLSDLVAIKNLKIYDYAGEYTHDLVNTNDLLGEIDGVVGVKTGTTDLAGEVLITQLARDNKNILIILINSQDRFTETKQIINWVFDSYDWLEVDMQDLLN